MWTIPINTLNSWHLTYSIRSWSKLYNWNPRQGSTSNLQITASLEVFLQPKKGVSPITYKPPLPLPATRPTVQSVILARSQPGLAQVTRSGTPSSMAPSRSQTTRTLRPQLDTVPRKPRKKPTDSTTVAKIARWNWKIVFSVLEVRLGSQAKLVL